MNRKELKSTAKKRIKKHYFIFLVIIVLSVLLRADYIDRLKGETASMSGPKAEKVTAGEELLKSVRPASKGPRGLADIVYDLYFSGKGAGALMADRFVDNDKNVVSDKQILGRQRGVLATLINNLTSGSFAASAATVFAHVLDGETSPFLLVMLLVVLVKGFAWAMFTNTYPSVQARLFLEGRIYDKIPLHRFLYLFRQKKWFRTAWIMFTKTVYYILWCFTIAGAAIKSCSYFMVPYIAAENPDMKANDAITLSRNMMQGHKRECFELYCSFLPWYIINFLTLGILKVFFLNAYKSAAYAEYAAYIRDCAKKAGIPGAELLNDRYLYEKADETVLAETYKDVLETNREQEGFVDKRKGLQRFFSDNFGLTFVHDTAEQDYEEHMIRQVRFLSFSDAVAGKSYPVRLSPIPQTRKYDQNPEVRYARSYSIWTLLLMFFTMSGIGWVWEVSLHLVNDGEFVNRGVMHGPWLPIYGTGGLMILLLLYRFRKYPLLEFFAAVVLSGMVEYFTALYLEITHGGQKWWDYTGYFLNLHGRICGEGLLVFGAGGMAIVYLIAPNLACLFDKLKKQIVIPLVLSLLVLFFCDQVYSSKYPNAGKGITDYTSELENHGGDPFSQFTGESEIIV